MRRPSVLTAAAAAVVAAAGLVVVVTHDRPDRDAVLRVAADPSASPTPTPTGPPKDPDGDVIGHRERPGGVVVPLFGQPDNGVLNDVRQVPPESTTGWTTLDETAPALLTVRLDSCALRAPGQWVLRGWMSVPGDAYARVRLHLGLFAGDMGKGSGLVWDARLRGTGAFALGGDGLSDDIVAAGDRYWGSGSRCSISVESPDVRAGYNDAMYADVTSTGDTADYTAPAGTTQALGVGARMDGSDHRIGWANAAWSGVELPFDEVWVSDLDGEVGFPPSGTAPARSFCRGLSSAVLGPDGTSVELQQRSECEWDGNLPPPGPDVEGAPGFTWSTRDGRRVARRVDDGVLVEVLGPAPDSFIARVAGSLRRVRNGAVRRSTSGVGFGPDLDEAVRTALAEEHFTERARFPYRGDGWAVVALQPQPHGMVSSFFATRYPSGWVVTGGGGGGASDCVNATAGGDGAGGLRVVVAMNAEHLVEERMDDGSWRALPTTHGAYVEELTRAQMDGWPKLGPFRAVDPDTGAEVCRTPG